VRCTGKPAQRQSSGNSNELEFGGRERNKRSGFLQCHVVPVQDQNERSDCRLTTVIRLRYPPRGDILRCALYAPHRLCDANRRGSAALFRSAIKHESDAQFRWAAEIGSHLLTAPLLRRLPLGSFTGAGRLPAFTGAGRLPCEEPAARRGSRLTRHDRLQVLPRVTFLCRGD